MRKLTSTLIAFLTMIVILATFSGVVSADERLYGWQFIDGYWYYYMGGSKATEILLGIDGYTYYFDEDGHMYTGWLGDSYFLENGRNAVGWTLIDDEWYFFDDSLICAKMHTGWLTYGGKTYYLQSSGIMAKGTKEINGVTYTFNSSGALNESCSGWVYDSEGYLYFVEGNILSGWNKIGNYWYYFRSNYYMACDTRLYIGKDGFVYKFDENGHMVTGWDKNWGKWYYYESNGHQCDTGWKKLGGIWYYFEPDTFKGFGVMVEGWKEIDGITYYLDNGAMATGWKKIDGVWYFFESYGAMVTNGWKQLGGVWYYFDENGEMLTGKQTLGDKTYVFDDNGHWIS